MLLSCMDVASLIDIVINSRIPNLINKGTPPAFLSFYVYQWITQVATHQAVDVRDQIRKVVHDRIPDCCLITDSRTHLANYRPSGLPQEVHQVIPTVYADAWLRQWADYRRKATSRAVEFKLIGPAIQPLAVAAAVSPKSGDTCAVCHEEFADGLTCLSLNVCTHTFCSPCLDALVNGAYPHKEHVPCPCCRADVCWRREIAKVDSDIIFYVFPFARA